MVFTGLPSPNVQYMLLTVGELKRVEGRLKLFKLQHLLQTEAMVKFDKPYVEGERGYTDFGTLAECTENGLIIQTDSQTVFGNTRYDYELSETGKRLYEIIRSQVPKKDMMKIEKVLGKYGCKDGHELMAYTHQEYIDDFPLSKLPELSKAELNAISKVQSIMQQLIATTQDPESYVMVGKIDHVKKIIRLLPNKAMNKIQSGTIIRAVQELEKCLAESAYKSNDAADDIFSFIENYAAKENILGTMDSVNLHSLPKEDQECLSKFLNQLKQP